MIIELSEVVQTGQRGNEVRRGRGGRTPELQVMVGLGLESLELL